MEPIDMINKLVTSGADQWLKAAQNFAGAFDQAMRDNLKTMENLGTFGKTGSYEKTDCCEPSGVCPPDPTCPPHCLAEIKKTACPGERIIVPFNVKNDCGHRRIYRIGVRPLVNGQGQTAPMQPWLDRTELQLEPGQSGTVRMTVDLQEGFQVGECYSAEIVIRESKFNQNICFRLCVENCHPDVEVRPLDERKYFMRWQPWQDHFYCEIKPKTDTRGKEG